MQRPKRITSIAILVTLALLLASAVSAAPASTALDAAYDLTWWTVDGGGGTLTDASNGYTLAGTTGQPDAQVWQGQGYTLAGGFWGGAFVEYHAFLPLVLRGF
jgi:phospholipase/lecithinase/hemolysin